MKKTKDQGTSAPRAREQLLHGDPSSLSNAELLTILIGGASAVFEVLANYTTLAELDAAAPTDLTNLPSLKKTGVARLLASKELSRRRAAECARRGRAVSNSQTAYEVLEPLLRDETREVVLALALDTKNRLICPPITISIGTLNNALVHPREVFRPLIRVAACSCILAHLHPSSGDPAPSPEDVQLTTRIMEAGELLNIPVHDHIIIGHGSYVSLADRALM